MAIFLSMGNYDLIRKEQSQTLGPVDYLLVGFPGNKFTGKIMPVGQMQLIHSNSKLSRRSNRHISRVNSKQRKQHKLKRLRRTPLPSCRN
jgi:hypothetical protein